MPYTARHNPNVKELVLQPLVLLGWASLAVVYTGSVLIYLLLGGGIAIIAAGFLFIRETNYIYLSDAVLIVNETPFEKHHVDLKTVKGIERINDSLFLKYGGTRAFVIELKKVHPGQHDELQAKLMKHLDALKPNEA